MAKEKWDKEVIEGIYGQEKEDRIIESMGCKVEKRQKCIGEDIYEEDRKLQTQGYHF